MKIALLAFALMLTACATLFDVPAVTIDDVNKAQFAEKPTYQEAYDKVSKHMRNVLIEPYSLSLQCHTVRKGWGRRHWNDKPIFGWVVLCDVDAKHQIGMNLGDDSHLFILNADNFDDIDAMNIGDFTGTLSGYLD